MATFNFTTGQVDGAALTNTTMFSAGGVPVSVVSGAAGPLSTYNGLTGTATGSMVFSSSAAFASSAKLYWVNGLLVSASV